MTNDKSRKAGSARVSSRAADCAKPDGALGRAADRVKHQGPIGCRRLFLSICVILVALWSVKSPNPWKTPPTDASIIESDRTMPTS